MGVEQHSWFYLYAGLKTVRLSKERRSNLLSDLANLHYLPLYNLLRIIQRQKIFAYQIGIKHLYFELIGDQIRNRRTHSVLF